MYRHHYRALSAIAAAVTLDAAFGVCFGVADHVGIANGLWFSTVTATTVGYGDITPHGWLPHVLAVLIMCTVIPLFGATFSLFTAGITTTGVGEHVHDAEKRIKEHTEERLRHHLGRPGG